MNNVKALFEKGRDRSDLKRLAGSGNSNPVDIESACRLAAAHDGCIVAKFCHVLRKVVGNVDHASAPRMAVGYSKEPSELTNPHSSDPRSDRRKPVGGI